MADQGLEAQRFDLVERLFHDALDLEPDQRTAWLERRCEGDAEALRLVQELLDQHATETLRLPQAALEWVVDAPQGQADGDAERTPTAVGELTDDSLEPGSTVGAWRILEYLGEGGMATVYRAVREHSGFEQQAAVKVIKQGVQAADSLERFSQEQRIAAHLDHPSIAKLIDAGLTADGRPFFALELVAGQPIDEYCDARKLTLRQRVALAADVGRALHYAHQSLLIHRDLKPDNVLVGDDGRVRLLDFGIAKALDAGSDLRLVETRMDRLPMTPRYASPEQIAGRPLTTASDQYQFGLLLFELLTGRCHHLLDGDESMKIYRRAYELPTPRPSRLFSTSFDSVAPAEGELAELAARRSATVRELRREIRGDLDTIVLKALAKSPERRYPSVAAMVEDLERCQAGRPISARRASLGYRARRWIGRNRALSATVAAVVVATIAMAAWLALDQRRQALQRRLTLRFEDEAVQVEQILRNARMRPLHDMRPERQLVVGKLSDLEDEIERLGPIARGPGHYALGRGYLALGELDLAIEHLQAGEAAGFFGNGLRLALGNALGELYRQESILASGLEREARRQREAVIDRELRQAALRYLRAVESPLKERSDLLEAQIAYYEGRFDDALQAAREIVRRAPWIYEANLLESRILIARAGKRIGVNQLDDADADLDAAGTALAAALDMGRSDLEVHRAECQRLMWSLESSEIRRAPFRDLVASAEAACGESVTIRPDLASPHVSLANLYLGTPLMDLAWCVEGCQEMRKHALAALALEPDHPSALHHLAMAEMSLARVEEAGGDLDAAGSLFHQARDHMLGAVERESDSSSLYGGLALMDQMLADWQIRHGRDPEEPLRECLEVGRTAVELAPNWPYASLRFAGCHRSLGLWRHWTGGAEPEAHLADARRVAEAAYGRTSRPRLAALAIQSILATAQIQTELGLDPEESLAAAETLLAEQLTADPDSSFTRVYRGATHLARAYSLLRGGSDPTAQLDLARRSLGARDPELAGNTSDRWTRMQAAQIELVAASWAAREGRDARPLLDAAVRVLDLGPAQPDLQEARLAAEIHRRRGAVVALRGGDPRPVLAAGLGFLEDAPGNLWAVELERVALVAAAALGSGSGSAAEETSQVRSDLTELLTRFPRLAPILRPYVDLLDGVVAGEVPRAEALRGLASLPAALPAPI